MQTKWLSAYIFSEKRPDLILRERIAPFLQAVRNHLQPPSPYFFIRYGEGGPHIRLRLHIYEEEENIVRKILEEYTPVQYVPYVQEVERYGDARTILLAEQQFYLCSDFVLSLIGHFQLDRSRTLIQGIKMNIVLLHALAATPDETIRICKSFIRSWLPRVYDKQKNSDEQEQYFMSLLEDKFGIYAHALLPLTLSFWSALQQGRAEVPLQQYADTHIPLFQLYRQMVPDPLKMQAIFRSLLHMQHNRLGIPNADEAYIVFFTMKCMEHIYEQISSF